MKLTGGAEAVSIKPKALVHMSAEPAVIPIDAAGGDVKPVFTDENGDEIINSDGFVKVIPSEPLSQEQEAQVKILEDALKSELDKSGIFSDSLNKIKDVSGIGCGTNSCRLAIARFKAGEITFEEALNTISEFGETRESSVNFAANITGSIAAACAGMMAAGALAALGGAAALLIPVLAGAGMGAAVKTGIKTADRASNNIDGDALDGKEILKDTLSGAVTGGISVITAGMGNIGASGTASTMTSAVLQGAKSGAISGGAAGAVMAGSDYAVETAVEADKDFSFAEFGKAALSAGAFGAVTGGITGGITGGVRFGRNSAVLENNADGLNKTAKYHIKEAREQIETEFKNLNSTSDITARPKDTGSIHKKLLNKFGKGKLKDLEMSSSTEAIGDAYGTRLQIKSLAPEDSKYIIEMSLKGTGITHSDFTAYLRGDISNLSASKISAIENIKEFVIENLKEAQTQELVNKMTEAIRNGRLCITELNNYGDEITAYFTPGQITEIADAYKAVTGGKLIVVTKQDPSAGIKVFEADEPSYVIKTKGAVKQSGYTSSQVNVTHRFNGGETGLGELQIRGTLVNGLADIEHITYDIRQGKIAPGHPMFYKYQDIYKIIKQLSGADYAKYNEFLTASYRSMRLNETGINAPAPNIKDFLPGLSEHAKSLLSIEGLAAAAAK